MKRMICLMLALTMLLTVPLALAENWVCPKCGYGAKDGFCSNCGAKKPDTSSDYWVCSGCGEKTTGNFCSNCGCARGATSSTEQQSAKSITISNATANNDGTITLNWNANYESSEGFKVTYRCSSTDNSPTFRADTVKGNSYTFDILIPGETYILSVYDSISKESMSYTVPSARRFNGPNISLQFSSIRYRKKMQNKWSALKKLSDKTVSFIDSIMDKDNEFWVVTRFNVPKLKSRTSHKMLTALYTPNGALYSQLRDIYLYRGYTRIEGASIYMNNVFASIKKNEGSIVTGRYKVRTYLDNMYVGEDYFDIGK